MTVDRLTYDSGVVAEVNKGVFIGTCDTGFCRVYSIFDAYLGVPTELDETIKIYWDMEGRKEGYPKLYAVEKTLEITKRMKFVDNKLVEDCQK